ncbi:hypothetical protein [Aquamicrobium sp. LC103]|uniref:hypothetical protein n=1 Tax=Aquamicrobium sp. LC103 TaxID=1120658 RepID=UPI00063E7741|nr:hypothetical protein [Aquamicrobium sp. LC103]TKT79199.1 hypothetical protein XW59_009725 [Aquamicrobium sp. LC103]
MAMIQVWELLSYMVTVIGLPVAIFFFVYEQRRQRENEEEEIYQILSDGYIDFLKLAIDNPDLKLQANAAVLDLTEEQRERMLAMFGILISLFERAYLVVYDDNMSERRARRWRSWEDFMREWCRREDFRDNLDLLLPGEDPDFAVHIRKIAEEENASPRPAVTASS